MTPSNNLTSPGSYSRPSKLSNERFSNMTTTTWSSAFCRSATGLAGCAAATPGMLETMAVAPAIFVNSRRVISSGRFRELFNVSLLIWPMVRRRIASSAARTLPSKSPALPKLDPIHARRSTFQAVCSVSSLSATFSDDMGLSMQWRMERRRGRTLHPYQHPSSPSLHQVLLCPLAVHHGVGFGLCLLVLRHQLFRPEFEGELVELAGETERHLIIVVVH
jgi:hypothetical protein